MLFVYAGYELNRGYIAAKLCENRAKPVMHCNGKCYLAKKIKQAEEKEKKNASQQLKSQLQEAFMPLNAEFKFASQVIIISKYPNPVYRLCTRASSVYQPPRLAA
ncbi:hypothetical protein DJ568_04300 [Mucilaginibacter hurinus]|uniref:Uncharacterized protein n=2 Tax=Mucilaginibacter hurinus TaxID=2201324 RepID=A0A367GR81_9SPHI|nr:hypothetical protein DJ568_04300 [Mucilaginibacter hurinus]